MLVSVSRRKTPFSDLAVSLYKSVHRKAPGGSGSHLQLVKGPGSGHTHGAVRRSWNAPEMVQLPSPKGTRAGAGSCHLLTLGKKANADWWSLTLKAASFQNFILRGRDTRHSLLTSAFRIMAKKLKLFLKNMQNNQNYILSKTMFSGVYFLEYFHRAFIDVMCVCPS